MIRNSFAPSSKSGPKMIRIAVSARGKARAASIALTAAATTSTLRRSVGPEADRTAPGTRSPAGGRARGRGQDERSIGEPLRRREQRDLLGTA